MARSKLKMALFDSPPVWFVEFPGDVFRAADVDECVGGVNSVAMGGSHLRPSIPTAIVVLREKMRMIIIINFSIYV